jgi:SCP-2 sterol transfer family protein
VSEPELLSDEWLAGLPGRALGDETVTGTFQYLVTGAAGGKVTYWARVDAGTVAEAGSGPAPGDPDINFEVPHKIAVQLDDGDLEPAVAYMQGNLKADGNMTTLFALLAAAHKAPS